MCISKTTNPIHFEDLDPHRFEQLVFELLNRKKSWRRLDYTGAKGNDDGLDLYGETMDGTKYYCQVKRTKSISPKDIKEIVDSIANNSTIDGILICFFACNPTKKTIDYAYQYSLEKGFVALELYTALKIETMLEDNNDLKEKYFGTGIQVDAEQLIKRGVKGKEMVCNFLVFANAYEKFGNAAILANPSLQFEYSEVHIGSYHSFENDLDDIEIYHKLYLFDKLDNGLELLLSPWTNMLIAININTLNWRYLENEEDLTSDEIMAKGEEVGLLPYNAIIDIDVDGNSRIAAPILYCVFEHNYAGKPLPYSKIYYKSRKCNVNYEENKPISQLEASRIMDYMRLHPNENIIR